MLLQAFEVPDAYTPDRRFTGNIPSTPPTPEGSPLKQVKAAIENVGNSIVTMYNRVKSASTSRTLFTDEDSLDSIGADEYSRFSRADSIVHPPLLLPLLPATETPGPQLPKSSLHFAPAFDTYSFAVLVATIFNGIPCFVCVLLQRMTCILGNTCMLLFFAGHHPYRHLTPSLVLVQVLGGRLRPDLPKWCV